jgi:pyruvate,water dikinase
MTRADPPVIWFDQLDRRDIARVGGKNASLGELASRLSAEGIATPPGFAVTTSVYRAFIAANALEPLMRTTLGQLETGELSLKEAGDRLRSLFLNGAWPQDAAGAIRQAYLDLCQRLGHSAVAVAVRSSATAEDLPHASFAGQQETFLNITGADALLKACRQCLASLFTDRAISYRLAQGFDHMKVALSIGVQLMVRSDIGAAGVMFSIDTESGFEKVVVIDAAWGLGEMVVKGGVDPDEYQVFKPLLNNPKLTPVIGRKLGAKTVKMTYGDAAGAATHIVATSPAERASFVLDDDTILQLARHACVIERHYGRPMDIEWAKAGDTGQLYILQARPETVQSRRDASLIKTFSIRSKGRTLAKGLSIGEAVAAGRVCVIRDAGDIGAFVDGSILVTGTTDPDWVPIMKRAAAIVTDHGGRTSHAAIISRELGLPAIVGTGDATSVLRDGQDITVSCAEGGDGFVYEGAAAFDVTDVRLDDIPSTQTQVMLNLADPAAAFRWWRLPADGVGLARMEFVISNHIKVHPMALAHFDDLADAEIRRAVSERVAGYQDRCDYFVDRLALGLARLAAAFYPKPVIIRTSDFKTNEYAHLLGGGQFEPHEENPMIGFRGASRYYSPRYQAGFALECRALKKLREEMGFTNVIIMIPFCRSLSEADRVLDVMAQNGLQRGRNGLEVYVMCEIPSNVILAAEFAKRFDGFSIGSNDLTQLTLGVDRDSEDLADLFDENDDAVRWMIGRVISEAHASHAKVGLCGQAPSDDPAFAEFLVTCGIDSLSVSPDSFIRVKQHVAHREETLRTGGRTPRA